MESSIKPSNPINGKRRRKTEKVKVKVSKFWFTGFFRLLFNIIIRNFDLKIVKHFVLFVKIKTKGL